MRTGLMLGATKGTGGSLDDIIATSKQAEADGFDNIWLPNIFGLDAIALAALIGRETATLGLGTAVVPSYPRHPSAMAQQAMTTAVASGGRFTLGIGLSHKLVIEDMLGFSYDKPARHMREYLSVLMPLIAGEQTDFDGEQYQVHLKMDVPGQQAMPVLVAGLGPVMLRLAGSMADGTSTWMTGVKTLGDYIVPGISDAASAAGRGAPRICAGLPIVLTSDPSAANEAINKTMQIYGMLPSYRAMLDREGAAGPVDVALVGDESELRSKIAGLRDAGVTDFNAAIVGYEDGAYQRTYDFLKSELA